MTVGVNDMYYYLFIKYANYLEMFQTLECFVFKTLSVLMCCMPLARYLQYLTTAKGTF